MFTPPKHLSIPPNFKNIEITLVLRQLVPQPNFLVIFFIHFWYRPIGYSHILYCIKRSHNRVHVELYYIYVCLHFKGYFVVYDIRLSFIDPYSSSSWMGPYIYIV